MPNEHADDDAGRETRSRRRGRRDRERDHVRTAARDRPQRVQALHLLLQRREFGRAGRQSRDLLLQSALGDLNARQLRARTEGDVLLGKGVRERRRQLGASGRGDDVEDVRVLRGFDLDFTEKLRRRGRDVHALGDELFGHSLRHFGRVRNEHFGVGFALGFATASRRHLQRGVRQRSALKANAGGRFI